MNIGIKNLSFAGYDASKIKKFYLEANTSMGFFDDVAALSKPENIEIETQYNDSQWMQDDEMILKKNGHPVCICYSRDYLNPAFRYNMKTREIPIEENENFIKGGNCFVGVNDKNERWLMAGSSALAIRSLDEISKLYDVKKENIFSIPQQASHIDMFLRPVGYPYVLVNDYELAKENLDFVDKKTNGKFPQSEYLHWFVDEKIEELKKKHLDTDEIIKLLKFYGFKPIRIAGVYPNGINFINAHVNKHIDGTMSYITHSTECGIKNCELFQQIFEQQLKSKVPNIKKVYFINSAHSIDNYNFLMYGISNLKGGLHCRILEEIEE